MIHGKLTLTCIPRSSNRWASYVGLHTLTTSFTLFLFNSCNVKRNNVTPVNLSTQMENTWCISSVLHQLRQVDIPWLYAWVTVKQTYDPHLNISVKSSFGGPVCDEKLHLLELDFRYPTSIAIHSESVGSGQHVGCLLFGADLLVNHWD